MPPPRRRTAPLVALVAVAAIVAVSACGEQPFDPGGPCTVDGQRPGAYPELEAAVPPRLAGRPPDSLDSGRSCSPANLGPLAERGVAELRFAGGVWRFDQRSGVTLAVFEAVGLSPESMAEFYEVGARAAPDTAEVVVERRTIGDTAVIAVETLNDESFQTIAVLDARGSGSARVALVGSDVREIVTRDAHERRVASAVEAWDGLP